MGSVKVQLRMPPRSAFNKFERETRARLEAAALNATHVAANQAKSLIRREMAAAALGASEMLSTVAAIWRSIVPPVGRPRASLHRVGCIFEANQTAPAAPLRPTPPAPTLRHAAAAICGFPVMISPLAPAAPG